MARSVPTIVSRDIRMQGSLLPPPQAPTPPPTPTAASPVIVGQGPGGVTTISLPGRIPDVGQLRARRSELSEQLNSANGRRDRLAQELRRGAEGADKAGIEERVKLLDKRILQIETDIAENGRLLTLAAGTNAATTTTRQPGPPDRGFGPFSRDAGAALSGLFLLTVVAPLAIAYARAIWRRANRPAPPPGWTHAASRLTNLEQAVDTIAVEIERVSESQRYLTRVLTEQSQPAAQAEVPALGPGQWAAAEPFPLPEREPIHVRRDER